MLAKGNAGDKGWFGPLATNMLNDELNPYDPLRVRVLKPCPPDRLSSSCSFHANERPAITAAAIVIPAKTPALIHHALFCLLMPLLPSKSGNGTRRGRPSSQPSALELFTRGTTFQESVDGFTCSERGVAAA